MNLFSSVCKPNYVFLKHYARNKTLYTFLTSDTPKIYKELGNNAKNVINTLINPTGKIMQNTIRLNLKIGLNVI